MKTLIASSAVAAFSFLVPAQCQPNPEPAPAAVTASASQSAYGVTLDAQPACAVFTARIWNNNNTARTARISTDGSYHSTLYAAPQSSDSETIYFPNNSGNHTVSVFWAGGISNYQVWTNCAP